MAAADPPTLGHPDPFAYSQAWGGGEGNPKDLGDVRQASPRSTENRNCAIYRHENAADNNDDDNGDDNDVRTYVEYIHTYGTCTSSMEQWTMRTSTGAL